MRGSAITLGKKCVNEKGSVMKALKKLALSLVLCIVLVSALALPTLASNHSDTALPTSFIGYTTKATTSVRSKNNTTPVYMNNKSGMTLRVYANGGSKPSSINYLTTTKTTVGGVAHVKPGQYRIHTWIREYGYITAWLNISVATSGVSGNCNGYWSPDSIGTYPSAN